MSTRSEEWTLLPPSEYLEGLQRLTKDLKDAARTLSEREVRYLVDIYYQQQRDRIRSAHQLRTLSQGAEPHVIMQWVGGQRELFEREVAKSLDAFSGGRVAGRWARSIVGIGPIIAAGLLAHIDIKQAPTVGHI